MILTLKQALEQRYSTKVFDPAKTADEEKIQTLIFVLMLKNLLKLLHLKYQKMELVRGLRVHRF